MNTKWIDPSKELPPQGKKILYFKGGEFFVVQRFGKYWLPIPFYDSKYAFWDPPELWANIEFPEGITGKVNFGIKDEKRWFDLDEIEMFYPEFYDHLMKETERVWGIKNGN